MQFLLDFREFGSYLKRVEVMIHQMNPSSRIWALSKATLLNPVECMSMIISKITNAQILEEIPTETSSILKLSVRTRRILIESKALTCQRAPGSCRTSQMKITIKIVNLNHFKIEPFWWTFDDSVNFRLFLSIFIERSSLSVASTASIFRRSLTFGPKRGFNCITWCSSLFVFNFVTVVLR